MSLYNYTSNFISRSSGVYLVSGERGQIVVPVSKQDQELVPTIPITSANCSMSKEIATSSRLAMQQVPDPLNINVSRSTSAVKMHSVSLTTFFSSHVYVLRDMSS